MKYRIDVKQCDISRGVPTSACDCPIALAIKRALRCKHVGVTGTYIAINDKMVRQTKKVAKFVYDFDSYKPVKPFSFTVNLK